MSRFLCLDQRQLRIHGIGHHRGRRSRAALLSVSVHCRHCCRRVVVSVDGHRAVDHGIIVQQFRDIAPGLDRVGLLSLPLRCSSIAVQHTGDFAFWLYLFGVMTFWGGITATSGGTNTRQGHVLHDECRLLVHLGVSRPARLRGVRHDRHHDLSRRSRGKVAQGLAMFPFALSLIGVGIIALGLYYYRHQDTVRLWVDDWLPESVKRLRAGSDMRVGVTAKVAT